MRTEIEQILTRLIGSDNDYNEALVRGIWVGRDYSKADLVRDLRRILDGEETTPDD